MSTIKVHWFLPTGGDSRDILPTGPQAHRRGPTHDYLSQVAQACDDMGFEGVLTPCGTGCEDAWISTASLIPQTKRLKFLVAFRPGLLSPTLAAQMASTYQRMSNGRMLINIVIGAEDAELARFGDFAAKDVRYQRAAEFLQILEGAWGDEPFDFDGDHPHSSDSSAAHLFWWGISRSRRGCRTPRGRLFGMGRNPRHGERTS